VWLLGQNLPETDVKNGCIMGIEYGLMLISTSNLRLLKKISRDSAIRLNQVNLIRGIRQTTIVFFLVENIEQKFFNQKDEKKNADLIDKN